MAILKIRQEMVRNAFDLPFNKWALGCGLVYYLTKKYVDIQNVGSKIYIL